MAGGGAEGEVVGCSDRSTRVMMFGHIAGLGPGDTATIGWTPDGASRSAQISPCEAWLGRVVDSLARPIDGKGNLPPGEIARQVHAGAPNAMRRGRLGAKLDLGVATLNLFATCRAGQRLGLFAGAGVGKSTLLAQLARNTAADVTVVALVGERGREVREFLEQDLGAEGLRRAVVVCATSDTSPLMRREAAYTAMAIAEHFRDKGQSVLLLMDSVTRFCLALREISLSAGEPPAARGFSAQRLRGASTAA